MKSVILARSSSMRRLAVIVILIGLILTFQNCSQVSYVSPKSSDLSSTGSGSTSADGASTPGPGSSAIPLSTPAAGSGATATPLPGTTPASGSNTPYGGKAISAPGKIEAENFDEGGEGFAYHDATKGNAFGSYRTTDVDISACMSGNTSCGFRVTGTDANEWLKYTISVTAGAAYSIVLHVATALTNQMIHIEVDDINMTGSILIPNTGSSSSWIDVARTGITLAPGTHVIKIYFETGGVDLDYITVKADPTPFSGAPVNVPGVVQAEDFDNGGQDFAYHDNDLGNNLNTNGFYRTSDVDLKACTDTGGGVAIGSGESGEWLIYSIDASKTGNYRFDARVAAQDPGAAIHMEIDGVNVTGSIAIPVTGAWNTTYGTASSGLFRMNAGRHLMRVFIEKSYLDFNYFTLTVVP